MHSTTAKRHHQYLEHVGNPCQMIQQGGFSRAGTCANRPLPQHLSQVPAQRPPPAWPPYRITTHAQAHVPPNTDTTLNAESPRDWKKDSAWPETATAKSFPRAPPASPSASISRRRLSTRCGGGRGCAAGITARPAIRIGTRCNIRHFTHMFTGARTITHTNNYCGQGVTAQLMICAYNAELSHAL